MTVLLIPKLSPRSSNPRANVSGRPIGLDACRPCVPLLLPASGASDPLPLLFVNERPRSPCRGRRWTGGDIGGGTSVGIPNRFLFS